MSSNGEEEKKNAAARLNDTLGNFRCQACQSQQYPKYGNFSGIQSYGQNDGCHVFLEKKSRGNYGVGWRMTNGPPNARHHEKEDGSRNEYSYCKCACHKQKAVDANGETVNWMKKEKWIYLSSYDAEN